MTTFRTERGAFCGIKGATTLPQDVSARALAFLAAAPTISSMTAPTDGSAAPASPGGLEHRLFLRTQARMESASAGVCLADVSARLSRSALQAAGWIV